MQYCFPYIPDTSWYDVFLSHCFALVLTVTLQMIKTPRTPFVDFHQLKAKILLFCLWTHDFAVCNIKCHSICISEITKSSKLSHMIFQSSSVLIISPYFLFSGNFITPFFFSVSCSLMKILNQSLKNCINMLFSLQCFPFKLLSLL